MAEPAPNYDICSSLEELRGLDRKSIGVSIASRLAERGFCTVHLGIEDKTLSAGNIQAQGLEACGRFAPPPVEVASGLLGEIGTTEFCELDCSPQNIEPEALQNLNGILGSVGEVLEADVLYEHLGFTTETRSHTVVHMLRGAPAERSPLTEHQCEHWLDQFTRHRLMAVIFLGPRSGKLKFWQWDDEEDAVEVAVEPGSLAVFRADALARSFTVSAGVGGCVALSCFFSVRRHEGAITEEVLPPPAWNLLEWIQDHLASLRVRTMGLAADDAHAEAELNIPGNWKLAMNHLYGGNLAQQICIRSASCRFPAASHPDDFGSGMCGATDFATEIPQKRFNWYEWYDSDLESWKWNKCYTYHGIFIEGAEMFDNKLFGISNMEAAGMDPTQYLLMETAYESLYFAGYRKKTMMNALVGVYVGQGVVEVAPKDSGVAMGGTGAARAVSCGRISFALGMQGPCCTVDSHGSTAWACVEVGHQSLRNQSKFLKSAISGSVMLNISPAVYVQNCATGLLSASGRSCTFDNSAGGYAKGEGCGFICMENATDTVDGEAQEDQHLGVLCSCHMASVGRSARLGAPNAASEQVLVMNSIRSAELSALNVDFVECVGDGNILSDAVEASYIGKCMRWEDVGGRPIHLGAVMSQVGFMREAAGFAQLLKVLEVLSFGYYSSNLHLARLNPHTDETSMESVNLCSEAIACRLPSNFAGVTSRGLGGTATHAVMGVSTREQAKLPHVNPPAAPWAERPRTAPWRTSDELYE